MPRIQQTADGADTLYSETFGQTYHSMHGALAEAKHVFLEASGVSMRLQQKQPTKILEVGFGVGLNFALTAWLSEQYQADLQFVSLEKNLLLAKLLAQLNFSQLADIGPIYRAFLAWRSTLPDEVPVGQYIFSHSKRCSLQIQLGDASQSPLPPGPYQAIYHDAFSPEANPDLWTSDFFEKVYQVMDSGAHLSTYSAKGVVRRRLQSLGFVVKKHPGPPGKREMLVATKLA